jgi:hypothetical protein
MAQDVQDFVRVILSGMLGPCKSRRNVAGTNTAFDLVALSSLMKFEIVDAECITRLSFECGRLRTGKER